MRYLHGQAGWRVTVAIQRLLIFGVSHFVYARFTAALAPAWLPPSPLFWTYATGMAQIAAGVAMLSGICAPLAAVSLTMMYAAFGILVHIPAVIARPSSHGRWAENAINLILTGAAWCLADSLSTASGRRQRRGIMGWLDRRRKQWSRDT